MQKLGTYTPEGKEKELFDKLIEYAEGLPDTGDQVEIYCPSEACKLASHFATTFDQVYDTSDPEQLVDLVYCTEIRSHVDPPYGYYMCLCCVLRTNGHILFGKGGKFKPGFGDVFLFDFMEHHGVRNPSKQKIPFVIYSVCIKKPTEECANDDVE